MIKNVGEPHLNPKSTRVTYPGKPLAGEIAARWAYVSAEPFAIVAGEAWRAGNVCCYSSHRPLMYSSGLVDELHFEAKYTPWTDDADFALRGGAILWDANRDGDALPDRIRVRFPQAEIQPPIVLHYRTSANVAPDRVGVAFIRPAAGR